MDMLLIVEKEWYNYLLKTKEFGIIKNIENMDFFVCTTSKSGIAFKGDMNKNEKKQLEKFKNLYKHFYNIDMSDQADILKYFFP